MRINVKRKLFHTGYSIFDIISRSSTLQLLNVHPTRRHSCTRRAPNSLPAPSCPPADDRQRQGMPDGRSPTGERKTDHGGRGPKGQAREEEGCRGGRVEGQVGGVEEGRLGGEEASQAGEED